MSNHTRSRISARRASTFLFVPSVLILGGAGCSGPAEPPSEPSGFSFGGSSGGTGVGTGTSGTGGSLPNGMGGASVGNGGTPPVGNGGMAGTPGLPGGSGGTPPVGNGGMAGTPGLPGGSGGTPPVGNGGMGNPPPGGMGNTPQGGSPGEAGGGGAGGSGGGSTAPGACTFDVKSSTSSAIGTVGIVEWSVTGLASLESAEVVFDLVNPGNDELNRGGKAPVSAPQASGNRTLLLGLKGNRDYTFRVVANGGGTSCESESFMIKTGPVANSVPGIDVTVNNAGARAGGFIVTSGGVGSGFGGGGGNSPVFILDADGDVVWWFNAPAQTSRAHMSWEGTDMWMMALNVGNTGGEMRRVSMDGLDVQMNVSGLNKGHHDFTVAPGGVVAVISWAGNGGDVPSDIIERSPDGTLKTVANLGNMFYVGGQSALGGPGNSYHANAIHFHLGNPDDPADDAYTISDRNPSLFIKVSRSGQLLWQFGGSNPVGNGFMVSGGTWQVNHGHHLLPNGNFLFFNNGNFGGQSQVLEYSLNETNWTAQRVWMYQPRASATLGDVQRLPNDNTLVTSSNTGTIQEVNSSGQVVQEMTVSSGSLGYSDWRPTLYGPPLR